MTKNIGTGEDYYAYLRGSWIYLTGPYFPVYKRITNICEVIYQKSREATRFYNNFLQIMADVSLDLHDLFMPDEGKANKKDKSFSISDTAGCYH